MLVGPSESATLSVAGVLLMLSTVGQWFLHGSHDHIAFKVLSSGYKIISGVASKLFFT